VCIVRILQGRLSLKSLSGPLAIYEIAGEEGRKGADNFVWVMALLSINLGLLNLLPIPVLDGGHIMFMALEGAMRRPLPLRTRERALATELSYGTMRTEPALRARLFVHAPRGVSDERVLAQLLVAAYQILLLDRVPAFAAVDAAVNGVKRDRGPRVAGFANAVLRKLCRTGEKLTQAQALREAVPAWLWQELASSVGDEQA